MMQAITGIKTMKFFDVLAAGLLLVAGWAVPVLADDAPASKQALRPYTINAGDEVEIYVWGEERLQRVVRILPDGTFAFPLVGRINAMGKLPTQIESEITAGLKSQYRGEVPQVTVSVRTPSGLQFSVIGHVKGPGTFTPGRYVNVIEALSFAGGPDEFAALDNVTIVRKNGNGISTIRTRLSSAFKGSREINSDSVPQIEGGDTVIVP